MLQLRGKMHGNPADVMELIEVEDPKIKDGEVMIQLVASPINPSDVLQIKGLYPRKIEFPMVFGNEGIGKVIEVTNGVTTVKPGDYVLLPIGTPAWQSRYTVPGKRLFRVNDKNLLQKAMASINPPTAYLMLKNFVNLEKGDWVIQNAANSAVGRYIIQLSKLMGYRTINIVRREELISELKEIGADEVIVDGSNLHREVKELTNGEPIKLGIDAVSGDASDRMIRCLAEKATLVVYGAMSLEPIKLNMAIVMSKDLTIKSFWLTHWRREAPREEIRSVYDHLMNLIDNDQLFAKISKTYPLREWEQALNHADKGEKGGKVLFTGASM